MSVILVIIIFIILLIILKISESLNKNYDKGIILNPNILDNNRVNSEYTHDNLKKNIKENEKKNKYNKLDQHTILSNCFSKNELKTFKKYKKYSRKLVYKTDNVIKGEVWFTPSILIEEIPQITMNGYFVNNLCVLKKYRRTGIGRKLMNHLIQIAKKEQMMHLILQVETRKDYLVEFYESLGFDSLFTTKNSVGEPIIIMFLVL